MRVVEEIELRTNLAELDRLTAFLEEFAEAAGLGRRDGDALTLAAEELFANTVEYAGGAARTVRVGIERREDEVILRYADDGPAFDPTSVAAPDLSLGPNERPVGGLGLLLLRRLMQDVRYERGGDWNVMTLMRRVGDGLAPMGK